MIEIYLLEQLNTFVSCGTLSEAAEKLHMTQPTLSRSMRKLEDYFGFPLFNRDKKRLSLNESGKLMAEYARKILDEELEMEKHVRNFHKSLQTLHIGSIAPGPLMVILPQGAAFYPDIAELTKFSELPSFSTNISLAHSANERISFVNIPFSDASATITYYLIYKQKNETRWRKILDSQSFCVPDTL